MLEPLLKAKEIDRLDVSRLAIAPNADGTIDVSGIKIEGTKMMFKWTNTISISLLPQRDSLPQIIKLNHSTPYVGDEIDAEIAKQGGINALNEKLQTPQLLAFLTQQSIKATGIGVVVAPDGQLTFALKK